MMGWKRSTLFFVLVLAFFSCAGWPSIKKSDGGTQESAPGPASSVRETPETQTDTIDAKPAGASISSEPSAKLSNNPATAQIPTAPLRDGPPKTAKPSQASTDSDAAHSRDTDTDYRLMALPATLNKQQTGKPATGEEGKNNIAFSFDSADLNDVIAVIADQIDMKYIIDPGIQGLVTIRTAGGISRESLLSVFQLILEVNGLTAVKDGEFYRITSMASASRLPIRLRMEMAGGPDVRKEDIVIQILPLQYIAAAEMIKLLEPFLSANGTIVSHKGSNTLLVVDTGTNIMKAVKLVEAFDIGLLEKLHHRFFFLDNADSEEMATILRNVFAPISEGKKDGAKFITIKRLNAFLALSSDTRVFNKIELLLLNLDAATESTDPAIHVYFVKNGTALNLAQLLNQVFTEAVTTAGGKKPQTPKSSVVPQKRGAAMTNPLVVNKEKQAAASSTKLTRTAAGAAEVVTEAAAGGNRLKGAIKITPDEIRNALILEATPADYRVIKKILKTIDVPPRQVLIEATIAEIDYSLITELGVTWEYVPGANVGSGLLNLRSAGDTGLTVGIGIQNDLRVTLNALERQNRVNILSSPHVLASDNQEARIDVSQEIPIVSAETVVPSGGESIVTTTVQYRDTGVLLAVTPHINERGLVTMDIYQEVSEQAEDVNVASTNYPSFFKRVVQTNLTVQHGQTIVLGGLIRENKGKASSGLPFLARMPVFGFLFGQKRDAFDKTELIILLTPKVIIDMDDVSVVTDGFKNKVDSVVKDMYEKRIAR